MLQVVCCRDLLRERGNRWAEKQRQVEEKEVASQSRLEQACGLQGCVLEKHGWEEDKLQGTSTLCFIFHLRLCTFLCRDTSSFLIRGWWFCLSQICLSYRKEEEQMNLFSSIALSYCYSKTISHIR